MSTALTVAVVVAVVVLVAVTVAAARRRRLRRDLEGHFVAEYDRIVDLPTERGAGPGVGAAGQTAAPGGHRPGPAAGPGEAAPGEHRPPSGQPAD